MKIAKTLIQAEAYFSLMYRRYLKQMVGWKRAMEVQLNQRCLIEKLQKVAGDHMMMGMVMITMIRIVLVMSMIGLVTVTDGIILRNMCSAVFSNNLQFGFIGSM